MAQRLKLDGTIRTIVKQESRKKQVDKLTGTLVIMNTEGSRIDVKGPRDIVLGFNPEDQVEVTVTKVNKTITEAMKDAEKKKKK